MHIILLSAIAFPIAFTITMYFCVAGVFFVATGMATVSFIKFIPKSPYYFKKLLHLPSLIVQLRKLEKWRQEKYESDFNFNKTVFRDENDAEVESITQSCSLYAKKNFYNFEYGEWRKHVDF